MVQEQPRRWAVVGGGMLGMTLAHRLAQQGCSVTLFEASDHLGGLADAWPLGDVVWDRHYHVILPSDGHLRGLLRELGLDSEIEWRETKTGFFTDGTLYSLSNTWEFLRFPPLGALDKLRLGLTILYASRLRDWRRLESVAAVDWLRRWSGRRTVEKIWLPLLRAKLGDNHRETSAAFIWAVIARMYAARRTGMKKELFGFVRGGYARVVERLGSLLAGEAVDVRLECGVRRIDSHAGGDVAAVSEEGREETFDRVVLTVPAPAAARMCPELSDEERRLFGAIPYQGIVCASLLLERPLADFYVTNVTDPAAPFTGVIEMTALVDPAHFGGRSLAYLPKYAAPDDAVFELSDEEIEARFVAGLEAMYPAFRREQVLAFRVSRVRQVMAIPTLNYSRSLPPMRTSVPGLFIVNSSQIVSGTLNVNEVVRLAETSVGRLLAFGGEDPAGASAEGEDYGEADRQLVAGS